MAGFATAGRTQRCGVAGPAGASKRGVEEIGQVDHAHGPALELDAPLEFQPLQLLRQLGPAHAAALGQFFVRGDDERMARRVIAGLLGQPGLFTADLATLGPIRWGGSSTATAAPSSRISGLVRPFRRGRRGICNGRLDSGDGEMAQNVAPCPTRSPTFVQHTTSSPPWPLPPCSPRRAATAGRAGERRVRGQWLQPQPLVQLQSHRRPLRHRRRGLSKGARSMRATWPSWPGWPVMTNRSPPWRRDASTATSCALPTRRCGPRLGKALARRLCRAARRPARLHLRSTAQRLSRQGQGGAVRRRPSTRARCANCSAQALTRHR